MHDNLCRPWYVCKYFNLNLFTLFLLAGFTFAPLWRQNDNPTSLKWWNEREKVILTKTQQGNRTHQTGYSTFYTPCCSSIFRNPKWFSPWRSPRISAEREKSEATPRFTLWENTEKLRNENQSVRLCGYSSNSKHWWNPSTIATDPRLV